MKGKPLNGENAFKRRQYPLKVIYEEKALLMRDELEKFQMVCSVEKTIIKSSVYISYL